MSAHTLFYPKFRRHRARGSLLHVFLGIFFLFTHTDVWAGSLPPVPTSSALQEVRSLYPSEWGVNYVEGVAYAKDLDHLHLLNRRSSTTENTTIVTITPFEDLVSRTEVAFSIDDAINMTFDNQGRRLLLLNNERAELAQIRLGASNILEPGSLVRTSIAAWNTKSIQGMATDKTGETLYLLDNTAQQLLRVGLTGASGLTNATITSVSLAHLGDGLRGLAIHPTSGHLYVGNPMNQRLYELTPAGQLIQAHSLWSLELKAPSGFVFAPSADRTDPPDVIHLLIANSNRSLLSAAGSDDMPNLPDHAVYLPLVGTPGNAINGAAEAILYGEVVEIALCKPNCSSDAWSFTLQVSSGEDDAEERIATGDMSELYSTDLEIIREAKTDQIVGIRFQNVTIPRGATIRYAALEFEVDEPESIETDLRFRADDSDDAAPFHDSLYNISRRIKTGASVQWQGVAAWNWIDEKHRTPNLAPIVQEIVNRTGWKNGNALAFILDGTGRRTAESYDGEPTAAPRLYIEYTARQTTAPATVETDPVPNSGDAADDPAIWVHPTDPALSTIIGTDKEGGIAVYDLSGRQLQYLAGHKTNNVDLRYDFPLGKERIALVAASSPTDDSIALYRVNPATRLLENVAARRILSALPIEAGACMYHSPSSGKYYVILNDLTRGDVEQWELFDNGAGAVDANLVRSFSVGAQTEGCVADDDYATLYIASEEVGIWKYGAEPDAGTTRTLIDTVGATGHLTADVEGLTIYYTNDGGGYLIASSQGSNQFVIYQRTGNNDYVTTFAIEAGNGIDKVSHTDGIDVTNAPLGPAFPFGAFVAQDDYNDGANQNFKLVPWESIAYAANPPLIIDTLRKP